MNSLFYASFRDELEKLSGVSLFEGDARQSYEKDPTVIADRRRVARNTNARRVRADAKEKNFRAGVIRDERAATRAHKRLQANPAPENAPLPKATPSKVAPKITSSGVDAGLARRRASAQTAAQTATQKIVPARNAPPTLPDSATKATKATKGGGRLSGGGKNPVKSEYFKEIGALIKKYPRSAMGAAAGAGLLVGGALF